MSKIILRSAWFAILLIACSPASRNNMSRDTHSADPAITHPSAIVQPMNTDTSFLKPGDSLLFRNPQSLLDLHTSENGDIVLSPGFYQADFKSYCLQPGIPSPSDRDAYLQAPLAGNRKDIVEAVLRNSLTKPELQQKNIQLLLWSIVSGADYNKLNWDVQSTAERLLTSKQIFALKGGYVGMVRNFASYIPDSGVKDVYSRMNQLFELGSNSYEVYERIAVPREPSVIHHPEYKKDQWYKQEDGYYVRYFPSSYKNVKVQVYVPEGLSDSTRQKEGNYLLFDPVTMMAIPANSNAQRLGIGAPVIDIIRKVIQIQQTSGSSKNPKGKPGNTTPPPTNPKPVLKGTKPVVQN